MSLCDTCNKDDNCPMGGCFDKVDACASYEMKCMCGRKSNEEHTGMCQLEHWLSYNCGIIKDDNALELRRIVKVITKEAATKIEETANSAKLAMEATGHIVQAESDRVKHGKISQSTSNELLDFIRSAANFLSSRKQQQKAPIALAIDKFQELAGKNVEAEFSVSEIIDTLEGIAQQ